MFCSGTRHLLKPETAPDVVKMLLEKFTGCTYVSSPDGIEACALVRLTSEALLAQMAKEADVHELFEWLWLSFIEPGKWVCFHDLTREVLLTCAGAIRTGTPNSTALVSTTLHAYSKPTVKSSIVYYSITFSSIAITRDPTPFHMAREP